MKYLLMLIPRFIEDYVVGEMVNGVYFQPECSIAYVEEHEKFSCMVKVKVFTWFNFSFPTGHGELMDYDYEKAKRNMVI